MKKNNREIILNLISISLILIGIYRLFQIIYIAEDFSRFFWICNFAPLIFGIAILFRNSFVLIGEFCITFFGQTLWTTDFLYFLFTGSFLFGSSAYILEESLLSQIASISVHVFVLPLSFIAILLIGRENKNAWKFSFILFSILLLPVLYYGSEYNLNFLFEHNILFLPEIPFYSIILPLSYIFLVVLPLNRFINSLLRKIRKNP